VIHAGVKEYKKKEAAKNKGTEVSRVHTN
jgi:hypothetical protein